MQVQLRHSFAIYSGHNMMNQNEDFKHIADIVYLHQ